MYCTQSGLMMEFLILDIESHSINLSSLWNIKGDNTG